MSRKHENFSYKYGWRTAPEQWRFYLNKKKINLNPVTNNELALLCMSGKVKDAEDELKRILRKEEKKVFDYICIGFFEEDGKRYHFTQDLKCHRHDLQDKLSAYKAWKRYIKSRNNQLQSNTMIKGTVVPLVDSTKIKEEQVYINLGHPLIIKLEENKNNIIFT